MDNGESDKISRRIRFRNPKFEIQNPKSEIQNPKSKIKNPNSKNPNPKSKFKIRNPEAETQIQNPNAKLTIHNSPSRGRCRYNLEFFQLKFASLCWSSCFARVPPRLLIVFYSLVTAPILGRPAERFFRHSNL